MKNNGRRSWDKCINGHPFTENNLEKSALKRGFRRCLICFMAYQTLYKGKELYRTKRQARFSHRRGEKPVCKHGHLLVPGNFKGEKRDCLTCHRERERQRGREKGAKPRTNMVARGICPAGHAITPETTRKGSHAGECAICHRLRSSAMKHPETSRYAGILYFDPCSYCGAPCEAIDHIVPRALGGSDNWDNLTAACFSCNSRKRTKSLLRFLCERVRPQNLTEV